MIKPTLALRKIAGLKKRIWVIQGGQGAAKTFSILLILFNHALANSNKEIFIASAELSKMRITVIKDFISILRQMGYSSHIQMSDTLFRFGNGSFIKFIGLDKEDIGKGLRSDIMFVNEANKIPFETYRELTSRAKRIIVDFNPNAEFWVHKEVITREDADFLILNYKDNEFLSVEERNEIERYRTMAYYDPDLPKPDVEANIKSKYWKNKWDVYGRGIIGTQPNRIFFWDEIPDEQYHAITAKKYIGIDWGTVDPWGILEAKYYDGGLYLHELNYSSENEIRERLSKEDASTWQKINQVEEGLMKWRIAQLNIDKKTDMICDNNRMLKIIALSDIGYDNAVPAFKGPGSIIDGINILSGLKVYYTRSSKNLAYEQQNYSRKVDKYGVVEEEPEDANNHCFCGSTMIMTDAGEKRMFDVNEGDYVITTSGPKMVLKKWDNGIKNVTEYLIQLDTFVISLICTYDHKIKTDQGWIEISLLQPGQTVLLNSRSMARYIDCTKERSTSQEAPKECMSLCGHIIMDLFQKAIKSIIRTVTRVTITSVTCLLLFAGFMQRWRPKGDTGKMSNGVKNSEKQESRRPLNGTRVQRAKNGTHKRPNNSIEECPLLALSANIAEHHTQLRASVKTPQDSVGTPASRHSGGPRGLTTLTGGVHVGEPLESIDIQEHKIVSIVARERGPRRVYDLTVDDEHEYFANGVLVHNCIDPARYIVLYLSLMGILKK